MSTESLTPFQDGVWLDTAPVNILGTHLSATMTVLRLGGDELLLYSPLSMTPERKRAIDKIGRVAHLYAPNLYHHVWIGEWAASYPDACLHAPRGLEKKRPDLRIDRVHGASPSPLGEAVEEIRIAGFRLRETVLFYRPARTLVVADLVHNVGRPDHAWSRLYTKLMGFYDRVALSRAIRWSGFSDRSAARASIDTLLALPFERTTVGHGAPLLENAKPALAQAFAWLR